MVQRNFNSQSSLLFGKISDNLEVCILCINTVFWRAIQLLKRRPSFSRLLWINPIMHCATPDAPDYYLARSCKMSVEVSWTMLSLKNHCYSRRLCGAFLAWYQQLSINVLQATFFTRVKHISMAYFVQIDPAMNKCILVSMRDTTSKEKCELSCLPMTAFDGSFIQGLRRKVYPVGCRVIKCSFVMFAHINVQSSFRWIIVIIQTVVLPLCEEILPDYSVNILLRKATSLSDQTSSMLNRWLAVAFTFIWESHSWRVGCLHGECFTLYFTLKFLRNNLPMIAFAWIT